MTFSLESDTTVLWKRIEPLLQDQEDSSVFYANPFSGAIHQKNTLFGRTWQCVYGVGEILTGISIEKKCLYESVATIKKAWKVVSKQIDSLCIDYKNSKNDIEMRKRAAACVLSVCDASPLFDSFLFEDRVKTGTEKVNRVFLLLSGKPLFREKDIPILYALREIYAASSLEGIMQCPIPVAVLQKIADALVLEEEEERQIQHWIQTVEQCLFFITPLLLYRALKASLAFPHQLACVLHSLIHRGAKILQEKDPLWSSYLLRLYAGIKLQETVTLANPLKHQPLHSLGITIHSIQEDTCTKVLVAKTPTALELYNGRLGKSWGVDCVTLEPVDKSGFFIISRAIPQLLCDISWSSQLTKQELSIADAVVSFVQWLMKQRKMPRHFLLHTLVVTNTYTLASLISYNDEEMIDVEYSSIEKSLKKIAGTHLLLFQYMMQKAQLLNHREATRIREAIRVFCSKHIVEVCEIDTPYAEYAKLCHHYFTLYKSQVEFEKWDMLQEAIIDAVMQMLFRYGIAASRWTQEELPHIEKSSLDHELFKTSVPSKQGFFSGFF